MTKDTAINFSLSVYLILNFFLFSNVSTRQDDCKTISRNSNRSFFLAYKFLKYLLSVGKSSSISTFILELGISFFNPYSLTTTSTKKVAQTGRWSEKRDSPRMYDSCLIPFPCHSILSHLHIRTSQMIC